MKLYISSDFTNKRYSIRDHDLPTDAKPIATYRTWNGAQKRLKAIKVAALKEIGQQKRQRHVFPTDEIPHLWMHQTQDSARNSGNLFFRGDTIYSYGEHFPIARHVTTKSGRRAVLFTTCRYSVTTSGHCSAVRSAIPSGTQVFSVPNVGDYFGQIQHDANLQSFVTDSKMFLDKARRARTAGDWELKAAFEERETARKYARFFKVPRPRFDFLPKGKELKTLTAQIKERRAKHDAAREQARERDRARRAEQERIDMLSFAEKSVLWRAGQYVRLPYSAPVMLRIKGDDVETSKGARIPVSHAKRGLAFVRKVVASGQEYVSNGHTFHLGHYAIDKVATDGTLTAGCHVITLAEIELLAPALDAVTVSETVSESQESEAANV